jgi:hypothetical protein
MEILICAMRTVNPCSAVTCLETHLTRTSLSENSCPHLFQYNVIRNAQVSDVFNFEVLKPRFVTRRCGDISVAYA